MRKLIISSLLTLAFSFAYAQNDTELGNLRRSTLIEVMEYYNDLMP